MSNPVAQNLREFTVQICRAESDVVVGTGIVVSPDGRVATCRHVVRDAVAGGIVTAEAVVRVRYSGPSHANRPPILARVVGLFVDSDDDVALLAPIDTSLTLTSDQVAVLGCPETSGKPHAFKSFGYRRLDEYRAGIAAGVILGDVPAPDGRNYRRDPVQLRADGGSVNCGMSGSGVLDTDLNLIVGLVSESWSPDDSGKDRDTAWAVDARVLSLEPLGIALRSAALPLEPAPAPRSVGVELPLASPGGLRILWNQAPRDLAHFVGRDDLLAAVRRDWSSESVRVTSLIGLGGAGKSYLARRAVEQILSDSAGARPAGVFWWSFNSSESTDDFLESLVAFLSGGAIATRFLTSSSARAQVIGSLLGNGRHVIVLDNLEALQRTGAADYGFVASPALSELLTYLASPLHNSFTIVTSRIQLHDIAHYATHVERTVGSLASNEAVALLRQLGRKGSDAALAREAAKSWNHPLALHYLAHLPSTEESPTSGGRWLSDQPSSDPGGTPVDRVLRQYDERLPPAQRGMMMILSVFRVPVGMATLRLMVFGGWGDTDSPLGLQKVDVASLDELVTRLVAAGLCQRAGANETVTVHPLAQAHYRAALSGYPTERTDIHWRAASALMATYLHLPEPPRSEEGWIALFEGARERESVVEATETIAELEPVVEAIHHCAEAGEFDSAWILHRSFLQRFELRYLWTRLGAYDTSLAVLTSLFPDRDLARTPGVSAELVSTVLNTTAIELQNVGRYSEALQLLKRSIDAEAEAAEKVRVVLNLVNVYIELGDFAEATKTLATVEPQIDDETPNELELDRRLAEGELFSLAGELELAEKSFSSAHEHYPEDEAVRVIESKWLNHLMRAGLPERAEVIGDLALHVYRELNRRPDEAATLCLLGEVALQQGEPQRALDLFRQGSSLAEIAGDYELRLRLMNALGRAEARFGDVDVASSMLEVALRMSRQAGLRPAEVEALVGLGWARLARHDVAEAARFASIALDQSEAMNYHWGVALANELAERLIATEE